MSFAFRILVLKTFFFLKLSRKQHYVDIGTLWDLASPPAAVTNTNPSSATICQMLTANKTHYITAALCVENLSVEANVC